MSIQTSAAKRTIGFWSVFAIVTGSQIGSGVFMLPANLAPYGLYGLIGWALSGLGALALSLVFASLCSRFPHTGGPHVYVGNAFGPVAAFFTGWTYWVISWISSTAVIVASVGYLSPFIGEQSQAVYLALEILLLAAITALNLMGIQAVGRVETLLTFLKFIPLISIPLFALFFFDINNLSISPEVAQLPLSTILGAVTLTTLWGFVGLESATVTADSVESASTTIPKAIFLGTLTTLFVYVINCVGIMGIMPGAELIQSKAPYVDATNILFGGNWHLVVSIIASIVCVATLNAWMLTSGHIALGLSEQALMPQLFGIKNKDGAPIWGLICSSLGIIPLLFLTANSSMTAQITAIIDFSVIAFLFVYLVCSLALVKLLLTQTTKRRAIELIVALIATFFCCWVMYETSLQTLCIASLFVISGLPLYLLWYRRK